ncbi:IS3 family transposase [Mediterraneibacter gnavus]|uniref:IS3 family transposase n=1 Tax=Mediterraneibacter gnavus TaxID=33038 RepID=UPI003A864DE5
MYWLQYIRFIIKCLGKCLKLRYHYSIESFHALLKREWINRFKIFNYAHAHKLIFEYIETFYNTVRIHSHCGYLSPNEYEEQYLENIEENAIKIAS